MPVWFVLCDRCARYSVILFCIGYITVSACWATARCLNCLIICLESKVKYSDGSSVVDCNRSLDSVVIIYWICMVTSKWQWAFFLPRGCFGSFVFNIPPVPHRHIYLICHRYSVIVEVDTSLDKRRLWGHVELILSTFNGPFGIFSNISFVFQCRPIHKKRLVWCEGAIHVCHSADRQNSCESYTRNK